jgi:hypothetical protein
MVNRVPVVFPLSLITCYKPNTNYQIKILCHKEKIHYKVREGRRKEDKTDSEEWSVQCFG